MWIKKYFRQLRVPLIIVPAVAVTFVSLFALISAATDAAASSQPGDLLYSLQQPALDLKKTLTMNPEAPARIELTPVSNELQIENAVATDSSEIQEFQEGAPIGPGLSSNSTVNPDISPEGGHESEVASPVIQDLSNESDDVGEQEDSAEFNDGIGKNKSGGSDQNHGGADDTQESGHMDKSGHGNANDGGDGGANHDNSGHGNGNDVDEPDDDNSGRGNGNDVDEPDDDNSGRSGDDNDEDEPDDDNSGRSDDDNDDGDNSGSGGEDGDDEEKDKDKDKDDD